MSTSAQNIQVPADCEIVTTRLFDFSQEQVFKAWSNPDYLKQWWGPNGFTNTFNHFDFKPEGSWSFIMHGPDNHDYPNECVFVQIESPRLLVWNHLSNPPFQIEVIFDKIAVTSTKLTFKMKFESPELCAAIRTYAPEKNEENMDRLNQVLQSIQ